MNLAYLDDVLVLLEEGNMSRAARRRNVTQPAFSRRIQSVEVWLGRPIVRRETNRVDIEPALLANSSELQALVAHIEELRRRIAHYEPGRSTVTIAAQHSLIVSSFPEFAATAQERDPKLAFRLRAANRNDCISMFLSGEASLLMCYERTDSTAMPFDSTVIRSVWGRDRLVPVMGGALRFSLGADGRAMTEIPVICYPPSSFMGEVLGGIATPAQGGHAAIETAFTAGIKEMALAGLGMAWLPMSLIHAEVQSGALIVCNEASGTIPLQISLFARPSDEAATRLCALR